jgi:hypothetical protein
MADLETLETEIGDARRSISADGYPMSIGELTNLYRDGELQIRPEFQRFYRWSQVQKSRLIESILLGIPLPSIFVAQTEGGKWELVDGLQRISTILELQGELRDKDRNQLPPLVLESTKFLPSLGGRVWQGGEEAYTLSEAQRLDIKRAKIDIKIIKRESSPQAKFDLFQRLNNYGSPLNTQEMRSALMVAVSPECFAWLEKLALDEAFVKCTQLSDRLIEERFDLELVTRFIILHNRSENRLTLSSLRDLPQVLDDEMVEFAMAYPENADRVRDVFTSTFAFFDDSGVSDQIFRRWDPRTGAFKGSFLSTAFEIFGLGIGYHIANKSPFRRDILNVVKALWETPNMAAGYATGRSTEARLVEFIPLGRQITSA